jgi:hypothetical protein
MLAGAQRDLHPLAPHGLPAEGLKGVLEAVALVFGARVSLGDFFSVTLLILALLPSRSAVRRLLQRPHQRAQDQGGEPFRLAAGRGPGRRRQAVDLL